MQAATEIKPNIKVSRPKTKPCINKTAPTIRTNEAKAVSIGIILELTK
jgi:hypothetical protein